MRRRVRPPQAEGRLALIFIRRRARRLQDIATQIEQLESALDAEALAERIASALNLVGQDMTRLAQTLQLEHGSRAIRLDRKRLTLIADTNEGPIPLAQIGSGGNLPPVDFRSDRQAGSHE
jgi:hypothetical protein